MCFMFYHHHHHLYSPFSLYSGTWSLISHPTPPWGTQRTHLVLRWGFVARFNWTFSFFKTEHKLKQDTSKSTHRSNDTEHMVVTEDRSYQGCPQQSIPTRPGWREYSRGHLCSPWGEQSIAVHITFHTETNEDQGLKQTPHLFWIGPLKLGSNFLESPGG